MKRILLSILIASQVLLSGCNFSSPKCHVCQKKYPKDANFCPNCGSDVVSSTDELKSEVTDFSNFGFQNDYGMTEWMEIIDFDFSNKTDAFVIVRSSNYVVNFSNGYLEERYFSSDTREAEKVIFSGDRNKGELCGAEKYNVVSNYVIEKQITNYPTLELTEVNLVNNIPIIYTTENHYPCLIPTYFIDFSRIETDQIVHNDRYFNKYETVYKYYIKKEFLR